MPSAKVNPRVINVAEVNGEDPMSNKDEVVKPKSFPRHVAESWICWGVCLFLLLASIVMFGVISHKMRVTVRETYQLCSTSSVKYKQMKSNPPHSRDFWIYNMTNPSDFYIRGETAKMHEVGPYRLKYWTKNENVKFEKDDAVEFVGYSIHEFMEEKSCPICKDPHQKVYTSHLGYSGLVFRARSEANLLMSQACSPVQIAQMSNTSAQYCSSTELMTAKRCRCCYTGAVVVGAVPCSSLLSPTSPGGGRLSWLAKYDGGLKVSSSINPNGFPLASGVYTMHSYETTPLELVFGSGSPFLGFFIYNSRISAFSNDDIANVTRDIGDVCYPLYCPDVDSLVSMISGVNAATGYQILRNVQCEGRIPDRRTLSELLPALSETRLDELRYVEGVNCRSFTPAVVTAALIANNSWTHTCHISGATAPCCFSLVMGSMSSMIRGAGWGCIKFYDGLIIKRQVYNVEDAIKFASGIDKRGTNCAPKEDRLVVYLEKGNSEFKRWVTPSTYTYPNMPWADPSVIQLTSTFGTDVTKTVLGTQKFIGQNDPQPMKQSFFLVGDRITDNEPPPANRIRTVFFPNALSERDLTYEGTYMFHGLQTLKYRFRPSNITSDESSQKSGEMPYRNMLNMIYAGGAPLIISLPNFHGVDNAIFNQTHTKSGPPGGGIEMYRRMSGYSASSNVLITPTPINGETNMDFSEFFIFKLDYAAITGGGVRAQIPIQQSTFTMNCNPGIDPTCALLTSPIGSGPQMCYPVTISSVPMHRPCSALNVFTPRVRGERIIPIMWSSLKISVPERELELFSFVVWIVYAASVGMIVFSILFVFFFLLWIYLYFQSARLSKHGSDYKQPPQVIATESVSTFTEKESL